jgi:hypothetical protein
MSLENYSYSNENQKYYTSLSVRKKGTKLGFDYQLGQPNAHGISRRLQFYKHLAYGL